MRWQDVDLRLVRARTLINVIGTSPATENPDGTFSPGSPTTLFTKVRALHTNEPSGGLIGPNGMAFDVGEHRFFLADEHDIRTGMTISGIYFVEDDLTERLVDATPMKVTNVSRFAPYYRILVAYEQQAEGAL